MEGSKEEANIKYIEYYFILEHKILLLFQTVINEPIISYLSGLFYQQQFPPPIIGDKIKDSSICCINPMKV
jgi:hypothetical protein